MGLLGLCYADVRIICTTSRDCPWPADRCAHLRGRVEHEAAEAGKTRSVWRSDGRGLSINIAQQPLPFDPLRPDATGWA